MEWMTRSSKGMEAPVPVFFDGPSPRSSESAKISAPFLKEITGNSLEIIIVVDRKGTITYANQTAERLLGYSSDELTGRSGFDLIISDEVPRALEDFAAALATNEKVIFNAFHVKNRDGSQRLLEGVGINLFDHRDVKGFVMNLLDATVREEAEKARDEAEIAFRSLTRNSPVGIFILQNHAFKYINAKLSEMCGYAMDDLINRLSVKDLAHPDDWPLVEKSISEAVNGKVGTFHSEFRTLTKSGETIHVEVLGNPISYLGAPAWIATVVDITDRKRIEMELHEQKVYLEKVINFRTYELEEVNRKLQRGILNNVQVSEGVIRAKRELEQIFDFLPELIALIGLDHRIIRVNKAMAEKFGMTPRRAVGERCYELFHGTKAPPPSCPHSLLLSDGNEHSSEVHLHKSNCTYEIIASPVHNENGDLAGCVHVARDITQNKKDRSSWEQMLSDRSAEMLEKNLELIREIQERRRIERELRSKGEELEKRSLELEELNTTLKVLLAKREEDRGDLEENVLSSIKHLVNPQIEGLKNKALDAECRSLLKILEANLDQITSSFSKKLSSQFLNLTPVEIKVANLVREGKSIKETSEIMRVSHFTVEIHRHNIRKKLGLADRKKSLQNYLRSIEEL